MRVSIRKTVVAAVAVLGMATAVASMPTPAEAQFHGGGGFHGGGFGGGGFRGGGWRGGSWGGGTCSYRAAPEWSFCGGGCLFTCRRNADVFVAARAGEGASFALGLCARW